MYEMVKLAGVSALLAATLVLATEPRSVLSAADPRPALIVTIDAPYAASRPDTRGDIVLK